MNTRESMTAHSTKSRADRFFASLLAAAVAVFILWGGLVWDYPDFVSGLAAGIFLAAAVAMYAYRAADEYTLAMWHAGTSVGFAMVIAWLLATALTKGFDASLASTDLALFADGRLIELSAVTAFLAAIGARKLRERA